MYVKLALRNVRRSAKDYLIYLITLILCVGLFYAFISITSPYYNASLPVEANLEFFNKYMKYAIFFISAVLIFLIRYVNNYMIKRKKKEFAVQTMMGMEQKVTAYMFFVETICVGFAAIGIGVLLGSMLSQAITVIILNYFEQTYSIYWSLFPDTILITIVFFTAVFCIIGLFNVTGIRKIKVIDMLNSTKRIENLQVSRPLFIIIIGGLTLISIVLCVYLILTRVYYIYAVPFLLFSVYGFFHCFSGALLLIKSKFIKTKYTNENLFLFGQITSKLKTTSKTMTTITLTLMGAGIALVMATVMSSWAMGYLNLRAVFDVQLFSRYNRVENVQSITAINYDFIVEYMRNEQLMIDSYVQTELYFLDSNDFSRNDGLSPNLGISLRDYNQLRKMTGLDTITLAENAYTTQWYQSVPQDDVLSFLSDNPTVQAESVILHLSSESFYKDSFGEMLYNGNAEFVYVLPDDICEGLTIAQLNLYVNTNKKLSFDNAINLSDYVYKYIDSSENLSENMVDIRIKTLQYNEGITGSLMLLFLLVYGGVVLIIMCFTILSLQQLSDAEEHKYRFNVLRKMGVDNSAIEILLLKQTCVWFGVPVIIAVIGSVIILNFIISRLSEPILAFVGANALALNITITCVIVIIILLCYFTATWILFKRNINQIKH